MKARLRFVKLGDMQYIGHLDLMRYFQKLFRRSGLCMSYSKGFNPHQIMSFASPLGVGLTSIGEYLDISLESSGGHTPKEWIQIINAHSNGLILVTAFVMMPDDAKPSMSLLTAATYRIELMDKGVAADAERFFRENESIIYVKQTKKSQKEIDLKKEIPALCADYDAFNESIANICTHDIEYEKRYICMHDANCGNSHTGTGEDGCIYMLCKAGSVLNIKPEMFFDAYGRNVKYQIMRLDMFAGEDRYISMSAG